MATLITRLGALVAAIAVDIKELQVAAGVGVYSVLGQFPGQVQNQVGISRYYPRRNMQVTSVKAWLSAPALVAVVAGIRKNGVLLITVTIPVNQITSLTATDLSITTADYITLDVLSGVGRDLSIRLDY